MQVLWLFKFFQCKSWSSILLARAAISDFLKDQFIYLCTSWDNLIYVSKHIKEFHSILTCRLSRKWWVVLYKMHLRIIISPTLIAELIFGLLEPYLNFKTPVSIYCSSIYLQSSLLKVVCLCYCELCLHLKSNHRLTAAESGM